jgi:hypothetical protein
VRTKDKSHAERESRDCHFAGIPAGTVRWIVKRVLPLAPIELICASGAGRGDCL